MRPFVYVASLRRSGSTLVAEALTDVPRSLILQEPRLSIGRLSSVSAAMLSSAGVDVTAFCAAHEGARTSIVGAFKDEVVPELSARIEQIGVKEIQNVGWAAYQDAFDDVRVVVTVRDPRDIYVSLAHRRARGLGWRGRFTPRSVARHLNEQAAMQLEMLETANATVARYEDVCADPSVIDGIRTFVDSPVTGTAGIGAFLRDNPKRRSEHELHGDTVSARQVGRWRAEPDDRLRREAARCASLMTAFCARWGYEL